MMLDYFIVGFMTGAFIMAVFALVVIFKLIKRMT